MIPDRKAQQIINLICRLNWESCAAFNSAHQQLQSRVMNQLCLVSVTAFPPVAWNVSCGLDRSRVAVPLASLSSFFLFPSLCRPFVFLQTDMVDRLPLCNNTLSLEVSHLADVLPLTRTLYKSVWELGSHEKPQFIRSARHFAYIVFQSHLWSTCVVHLFTVVRGESKIQAFFGAFLRCN